jgi:hypothetical protein
MPLVMPVIYKADNPMISLYTNTITRLVLPAGTTTTRSHHIIGEQVYPKGRLDICICCTSTHCYLHVKKHGHCRNQLRSDFRREGLKSESVAFAGCDIDEDRAFYDAFASAHNSLTDEHKGQNGLFEWLDY